MTITEIALKAYDLFEQQNMKELEGLFSSDIVFVINGNMSWSGTFNGFDDMVENCFSKLGASIPDFKQDILQTWVFEVCSWWCLWVFCGVFGRVCSWRFFMTFYSLWVLFLSSWWICSICISTWIETNLEVVQVISNPLPRLHIRMCKIIEQT